MVIASNYKKVLVFLVSFLLVFTMFNVIDRTHAIDTSDSTAVEAVENTVESEEAVEVSEDTDLIEPELLEVDEYAEIVDEAMFDEDNIEEFAMMVANVADLPTASDGSNIESIGVGWITTDDNDDDALLHQEWTDNNNKFVRARINFALSGQHNYDPGTVQITIPKQIFRDRSDRLVGVTTLAVPEAPDSNGLFNYTETADSYIITNTKVMSAASSGMIELTFNNLRPSDIRDYESGYVSDPFSATIEVVTKEGTLIGMESNEITATVGTNAQINSAYKRYDATIHDSYPASFPAELRPANPDNYYYASWTVYAMSNSNQYFDILISDNARASDDARNALALGYKNNRTNEIYRGTAGTINAQIEDNYYVNGRVATGIVYTAYPKADFDNNRLYNLKNTVTFTMTAVDDGVVTTTNAESTLPFSPLEIEFPTGSFIVHKQGDGQTEVRVSGKQEGVYATALNKLAKGEEVDITYDVNPVSRGGGFTLRDGGNPENINDYNHKHYTMIVEDYKTTFHDPAVELTSSEFEFKSLRFTKPLVQEFALLDDSIENELTGSEFTVGGRAMFKYATMTDADIPDTVVFGQVNGGSTWVRYGTVSWKTGTAVIAPENGATVNGATIVFPDNVTDYKTETQTTVSAIQWRMYPTVTLKPTAGIQEIAEELFDSAIMPKTLANNHVKMNVLVNNSTDNLFINEDIGRDQLIGFAYGVNTTKSLAYENNTRLQNVDLTYTLKTRIQTNLNTLDELNEAIADGLYEEETSGTFYDLLPVGVIPDTNSLKVRSGDTIENIQLIQNYKDTGRTLMIVDVNLKPTYKYDINSQRTPNILEIPGYYDEPTLTFNARYSWFALSDFGETLDNYSVYESGKDTLGSIEGLKGEPDDPTTGNNNYSQYVLDNTDIVDVLKNINPDNDNPSYVYAKAENSIQADVYNLTSLHKQVDVNSEGIWGDGLDNFMAKNVYEGGEYSYNVRIKNTDVAKSKDIVFYDNLENYVLTDDKADHGDTQWRGIFESIDVSQLVRKGVAPVVYYSTQEGLILDDTLDRSDLDLTNSNIWSTTMPTDKTTITAIAIDARKAQDGNNFVLNEGDSLSSIIHMRAPMVADLASSTTEEDQWFDNELSEGESEAGLTGGAHAYNNISMLATTINVDSGSESDYALIRNDYVKVGLKPYIIEVNKTWDDDNNRDGLRTDNVVMRLYANGVDTGRTLELNADNDWSGEFTNISYLDDNGNRIFYNVQEDTVDGYDFIPGEGVDRDNGEGVTYNTVNRHVPERINITGEKLWDGGETRPPFINVTLVKNGENYRTITVQPDAQGDWNFTFNNLFKFENGEEIEYSIKETNYITGYVQTIEDFTITNTYDPFGELVIGKEVIGATEASIDINPDFSVEFTIFDPTGEVSTKEYDYTKSNGTTGKISSGGVITLKDGETATIHEVDSDVDYELREVDLPDGYSLNEGATGALEGQLQAGQSKTHTIVNNYDTHGSVELDVSKSLTGRQMFFYEFQFDLIGPDGNVIRTAGNTPMGEVNMGLLRYGLSDVGKTYTYQIVERQGSRGGVTYDNHVEDFTVDVVDNGDGTITPVVTYDEDSVIFNNTYEASGSVEFVAWKMITGGFDVEDGQFDFEVVDDATGEVVATGSNDVNGVINFSAIEYDETMVGQTFTYTAREVHGSDDSIVYDDSTISYTVEVFDNFDGTLSFNSTVVDNYTEDADNDASTPLFVNEYKPGSLSISKDIVSGDPHKEFKFKGVLKGPDGLVPTGSFDLEREYPVVPVQLIFENVNGASPDPISLETEQGTYSVALPETNINGWFINGRMYDSGSTLEYSVEEDGSITIDGVPVILENNTFIVSNKYVEGGTQGGVIWSIDGDGELLFRPQNGVTGTFHNMTGLSSSTPWVKHRALVKTASFADGVVAGSNSMYMFAEMENLTSIDFGDFDTSNVISMNNMFSNAKSLTSLDLSGWDTSNVTNMDYMFSNASGLTSLDLSGWDTSNVTRMTYMFSNAKSLTSLDLSGWDTSNVTRMNSVFSNASGLTSLDLSGWDTSNVTRMDYMFSNASGLTSLDLSGWDTSNVTRMDYMFSNASGLTSLDLSGWDTSNVTDMTCMFRGANLTELDLSSFDTSNVKRMDYMFSNASGLTSLDLSGWDTSNVTNMDYMFSNASGLTSLDLSGWDTSNVKRMTYMFSNAKSLTSLDLSGWDTSNVKDMSYMFSNASGLTSLDLSSWDTSNVTNMNSLFRLTRKLDTLIISDRFVQITENPRNVGATDLGSSVTIVTVPFSGGTSRSASMLANVSNYLSSGSVSESSTNSLIDSTASDAITGTSLMNTLGTVEKTSLNARNIEPEGAIIHSGTQGGVMAGTSVYSMLTKVILSPGEGATGSSIVKTITSGSTYALPEQLEEWSYITPEGYERLLTGWKINDSSYYMAGQGIIVDSNMILTAQWSPNQYSISFNSGYAEVTGVVPERMFLDVSQQARLPKPELALNKNGFEYTFSHWLMPDGSTVKANAFYTGNKIPEKDLVATAVWTVDYRIAFNTGGNGSIADMLVPVGETVDLPTPQFKPAGKAFQGWSLTNGGEVITNTVDLAQAGTEVTLYAVWGEVNNDINIVNGEFEFSLWSGETVTLPEVPSGLTYEIYEETEDGWVLVSEIDSKGTIQPQEESLAQFVNDYRPGSTSAVISGIKTVDGSHVNTDGYVFELYEGSELIDTATSGYDGSFSFDNLVFDNAGVYTYTVREVAGDDPSVVYDTHIETVTVNVRDNGDGTTTATVQTDDSGVSFNNTSVKSDLTITKNVSGTTATDVDFTVRVSFNDGLDVELITLKNGESYTFSDLDYGTTYEVKEINVPRGYSLTSISNATGTIGESDANVVVNNQYNAMGSFMSGGFKEFAQNGRERPLQSGEFTFELVNASGAVVGTASNDADGNFTFDAINVNQTGTTTYTIREVAGNDSNIAYDNHVETITVTAVDRGNGYLETSVQTDADGVVFVNSYVPSEHPPLPGQVVGNVAITKEVVNTETDREFPVVVSLTGADGNVLESAYGWTSSNGESGSITHNGTLNIAHGETITINNLPYNATVAITEDAPAGYTVSGASTLETTVPDNATASLNLINVYEAQGMLELNANKVLEGGNIEEYGFNFLLLNDGDVLQRVENNVDGSIEFEPIYYSMSDVGKTFTYEVVEQLGTEGNINYDDTVYEFTVTVSDNGDGTLSTESNLPENMTFTNEIIQEGDLEVFVYLSMDGTECVEGSANCIPVSSVPTTIGEVSGDTDENGYLIGNKKTGEESLNVNLDEILEWATQVSVSLDGEDQGNVIPTTVDLIPNETRTVIITLTYDSPDTPTSDPVIPVFDSGM